MVAEAEIEVGVHDLAYAALDILAAHVAPCYGGLRRADDVGEVAFLVAERFGDYEGDFHVATLPHALGQAIAGGSQTAEDVRGKLPSKH